MSGDLIDGACKCDGMFTGKDCAALNFATAPSSNGLLPNFASAKQMTWGGSPIKAKDGKYHLFFSWFKMPDNSTCPTIKDWYKTSVVAHAVSDEPGSDFQFVDIVLSPRGGAYFDGTTCHNPTGRSKRFFPPVCLGCFFCCHW
jgi:hypothetical protein